jgi:hypothetical protein
MLDEPTARRLANHWEDSWNAQDIDLIMEPMGEEVVFSSPFVSKLLRDPGKWTVEGYDAVRSYLAESLKRVHGVTYRLDRTYTGADTIVIAYTFRLPDGTEKNGADFMRVDREGKVVDWRSQYPFGAEDVYEFIED